MTLDDRVAKLVMDAARVRVHWATGDGVACEGKVIAAIDSPVIVVEDDNGERHYHPVTLPIYVQHIEWRGEHTAHGDGWRDP